MADNFEQLGFQVKVDGADSAVSNLDRIVERLERVQKLQGGKTGKSSKKGFEFFSQTGELNKADTKSAKRSGNYSVYEQLKKQIAKEIELNHIWKQQVETLTQLNLAKQKKLTYDLLANNEDVKSANVQAEISKIMAKTAIDTGVLAKEEGKLAIAKQATVQYDKQSISNMAKLQAEQNALNDGKWEEARRIELANNARKKEIDQRLKQELGLKEEKKQVDKNINSWSKYIAKITSVVAVSRRIAHFISGAIKESANYIENLNLFAVAYGEAYQEQLDWALGIAKAYGLANNEVLKFAGTFRELSTSLGLVSDTADLVSETVTNLGYDLAALFNTTVEQAMEKLQSGVFSGNVRPLRAYGIDISQNQIDALFETNEALRQLGVNAKNLSQSDKVLARLIITLQSGKDSFGTMAREINNLQSQFRIFQGSLANFKLAIGDLVNKPLSQAMVYINGFIIAMTNVIRAFVPLTTEDETPKLFSNTTLSAEEASESIDKLNGKLANFDKFNVLQQGEESSSSLAITEALNKLLLEQSEIYKSQLGDLTKIGNKATEVAKKITDFFIEIEGYDEESNPIYGLTAQIELLIGVLGTLISMKVYNWIFNLIGSTKLATGAFNLMATASNVLAGVGLFLLISNTIDLIKNWDKLDGKGKAIRITLIAVGGALTLFATLTKIASKNTTLLTTAFKLQKVAAIGLAVGGIGLLVANLTNLIGNWDELNGFEKVIGIFGAIGAAALAAAAAVAAFHGSWTLGTAAIAIIGGLSAIAAAFVGFKANMKDLSIPEYANGGILPDKGTLFIAGEAGAEIVYNSGSGNGGIANVQQIAQATYQGTMAALEDWWGGINAKKDIPQLKEANATGLYQTVTGVARSYGNKWAKV